MTWERIQTEIKGRVGVITINYPPANSLGYQTMKELGESIESFLKSSDVSKGDEKGGKR